MFLKYLPPAAQALIETYDPNTGVYRKPDGSVDAYPTELEVLGIWYNLARCVKAKTIVEAGTYCGLATCVMAAALEQNKFDGAKIHTIDPWNIPHLWDNSSLGAYISYLPCTSQEAEPVIRNLSIDILIVDSIHDYVQSGWELSKFEPYVREGGYILMHDSLFFDGVGRTARHLYDNPRFEATTFESPRAVVVPHAKNGAVSMGCTIARKIRHGAPIVLDELWLSAPSPSHPAGSDSFLRLKTLEASG